MLSLLIARALSVPIAYSSAIQLKSVFTKNRLGVTTDSKATSYQQPLIYSSRPPYEEGWFWTIEPDEEDFSRARSPVMCGSAVALSSPITGSFLSARITGNKTEVIPLPANQGAPSQWIVECQNGPQWTQGDSIFLINLKYKCYLTTSFAAMEFPNKYEVGCGKMSANAVWKAAEGIYFPSEASDQVLENEPEDPTSDSL
jgi:hypothetical protein